MGQLKYRDRIKLEALLDSGVAPCEAAHLLCKHHSTIYREIRRGEYTRLDTYLRPMLRYSADVAQQKHDYASTAKGRPLKISNDFRLATFLELKICQDKFSPAAALAEARRQGISSTHLCVSTLYSYIDKQVFLHLTNKHLLVKSKTKHKYDPVVRIKKPLFPTIHDRPVDVRLRDSWGNWEMDTVEGKEHSRACLLVLTERMTRYEIIAKLPGKNAKSVVAALNHLERQMPDFRQIFQTITCDNGSEFMDYSGMIRSLSGGVRTHIYYCDPYRASQRGSNENCNKIIRRWVPKSCDIGRYTKQYIAGVQRWINDYPRRILGYQTAADLALACAPEIL